MVIAWSIGINPLAIRGLSNTWTDGGSPLPYTIQYFAGRHTWTARFESHLVCRGTLQQCMAACEAADRDGVVEAHPGMDTLRCEMGREPQ